MNDERYVYDNPSGFGKGEIIDKRTNVHYEATISTLLGLLNNQQSLLDEKNDEIKEKDKLIEQLLLKINGLDYALKNIKKINVEIDLDGNE